MTCILGRSSHREQVREGSLFQVKKKKKKQPVVCLTDPREVQLLYPPFYSVLAVDMAVVYWN